MTYIPLPLDHRGLNVSVNLGDTNNVDAFGRIRVGEPEALFSGMNVYKATDLWWDSATATGSGTPHHDSRATSRAATDAARRLLRAFTGSPEGLVPRTPVRAPAALVAAPVAFRATLAIVRSPICGLYGVGVPCAFLYAAVSGDAMRYETTAM